MFDLFRLYFIFTQTKLVYEIFYVKNHFLSKKSEKFFLYIFVIWSDFLTKILIFNKFLKDINLYSFDSLDTSLFKLYFIILFLNRFLRYSMTKSTIRQKILISIFIFFP